MRLHILKISHPIFAIPLFNYILLNWSFNYSNMPSSFPSLDLCTCCFFCQEHSCIHVHIAETTSMMRDQLKNLPHHISTITHINSCHCIVCVLAYCMESPPHSVNVICITLTFLLTDTFKNAGTKKMLNEYLLVIVRMN